MATSFIVVDDFFPNPLAYREKVLSMPFSDEHHDEGYPGRMSEASLEVPGMDEAISRIVGQPLKGNIQSGHGRFRLTLEGDDGAAGVHLDPASWSAILYLTPPEYCQGGTNFYRHKATGTERAIFHENFLHEYEARDLPHMHDIVRDILKEDGKNPSAWEKTMQIPMRFNRLVILRPYLWHTASPGFGDSIENGRLIQIMFFDVKK